MLYIVLRLMHSLKNRKFLRTQKEYAHIKEERSRRKYKYVVRYRTTSHHLDVDDIGIAGYSESSKYVGLSSPPGVAATAGVGAS